MARKILGEREPLLDGRAEIRTGTPDSGFEAIDATCGRFKADIPSGPVVYDVTEEEADLLRNSGFDFNHLSKPAPVTGAMVSELVERLVYIDTKPFRFVDTELGVVHNRNYLKPMYDFCKQYPKGSRNQVWATGRQVEKSTSQAGKSIVLGAMRPAYKSLYIAPRGEQVNTFSSQRFKPMVEDSPAMMGTYIRISKSLWKVTSKEFLNRSLFNFRSCYLTADGCRGISAHHLMIDEIQDILSDNIPVIEECQSHWGWETGLRVRTYAGTPKTNSNAITRRFNQSSQFEWIIKCQHCNHWNFPDEKVIGPTCYVCTKCAREIYPQLDGHWEPMNRAALDECWGFRIPQIIVPFKTHADVFEKMNSTEISRLTFFNEVLGLPYDEGEVVLTENDMKTACTQGEDMLTPEQIGLLAKNNVKMFAGLDHGTGEGDNASFTVLTIGHFESDVFKVRYVKKFVGAETNLAKQPAAINAICVKAGVSLMFADWGFGAHQNARLVEEYGWEWHTGLRVLAQAMYVRQKSKIAYDVESNKYHIDRNKSMSDCIDAIKRKKIRFFRPESFFKFQQDFITIFLEYDERHGTSRYDHVDPDDAFHSVNYAYMAGLLFYGKLDYSDLASFKALDVSDLGFDE